MLRSLFGIMGDVIKIIINTGLQNLQAVTLLEWELGRSSDSESSECIHDVCKPLMGNYS